MSPEEIIAFVVVLCAFVTAMAWALDEDDFWDF